MTEVSLTIVYIREGLLRLLDKARKKIPKLPKLTQSLENHYISVPFEEDKDTEVYSSFQRTRRREEQDGYSLYG